MRLLLVAILLSGCAGQYVPPLAVSFGGLVTVSEPGFTVPAKVVQTAAVTQPTLMVPSTDPAASMKTIPVTTASGSNATVPVTVAPVTQPVLAIPK